MRSIAAPAVADRAAATRIVCLPGAFHAPEDFLKAAFDSKVRERGLCIDLLFIDPELQHLGDRRFRDRLKHDIVSAGRAEGCQSIWLAGISLGGFIALDYAAANPDDLDGLCLLAPYLGNRMLAKEIADAGGLDGWAVDGLAEDDDERRIWRFIQAPPRGSPPVYLGYGLDDRFAGAHRLMAQALPAKAVDVVAGGHDWRTWTILWENFLDARFK